MLVLEHPGNFQANPDLGTYADSIALAPQQTSTTPTAKPVFHATRSTQFLGSHRRKIAGPAKPIKGASYQSSARTLPQTTIAYTTIWVPLKRLGYF